MQEDGASAVVGSSMILFITVAGIGLALAVGVPLLSEVQGFAMAKGVSEDFIGAAKDIEGGSGELDITISIPGSLSLPALFGGITLGFEDGTEGFISGGSSCFIAMDDWTVDSFELEVGGAGCTLPTNSNGNCELVAECLAVDKWQGGRFVPQEYNYVAGVVTLDDPRDGIYRISVLDVSNGERDAVGYFFEQQALTFNSGPGSATLENGAYQNGDPRYSPYLTEGADLVLLSGNGVTNGGGTWHLRVAYQERLPAFEDDVQYINSAFKGGQQFAYCFAMSPTDTYDCAGPVSQTSYDGAAIPFRISLQLAEASIGL